MIIYLLWAALTGAIVGAIIGYKVSCREHDWEVRRGVFATQLRGINNDRSREG